MVLQYINMNLPQVYTCSPSWTPHPPPSLYHPSGSSQCTSPKHPVSCIKPRLAIRFLYDIIRFNAILPNHPTLSLSHRVQKTVLHICVFFAVSHTGHLFLNLDIFEHISLFFFFNCSVIASQCCASFRCTTMWINYIHTYTLTHIYTYTYIYTYVYIYTPPFWTSILPPPPTPPLGYHRALSWAPGNV